MELNDKAKKVFQLKYSKNRTRTWKDTVRKVADLIAQGELSFDSSEENLKNISNQFYNMIYELELIPGGRILANSGTGNNSLANCFVLDIEDSRKSIYGTLGDAAEVFAAGGGVGFNFSKLREEGAYINSSGGRASGPLSFMTLFDQTGEVIQQASRRGAQMGILNIDHPDIEKFIGFKSQPDARNKRLLEEYDRNLKTVSGNLKGTKYHKVLEKTLLDDQLTHFNISVMLTDAFMVAVKFDGSWNLVSPSTKEVVKTLKARDLLKMMASQAWESGDPGVVFYDRINKDNMVPYISDITATNPCLYKDTILYDVNGFTTINSNAMSWKSWKTGEKETILVKTNAGHEIILTPDHKIMLEDGTFVEAKDSLGKQLKWGLGKLSPNLKEYTKEEQEKKKLFGFIFGDGYLCGNKEGVSVKLNSEKENEIYNLLVKYGFKQQKSGALYIKRDTLERTIGIVDSLEYHTYNKDLPKRIFGLEQTELSLFLSGLFEANGSVTASNGQISFKSTSKNLVQKLQILLSGFGIKSWIVTNKAHEISWKNGVYLSKQSYNLQIAPRNARLFKDKIGFISEYKNNKIKEFIKDYDGKLIVTSIEPNGIKEVWDFSNEVHYENANGIVAHNCSEIPLLPGESCVLASLNLHAFYDKEHNDVDYAKLMDRTRLATRFLDDVVEVSEAPVDIINKMTKGLRKLGLGVMGFADLLVDMNIPYGSEESIKLAEHLSWFISYYAWMESIDLSKERGAFEFYDKDKVDLTILEETLFSTHNPTAFAEGYLETVRKNGVRNVSVTCIAPTGSIAIIGGVNSGIEPFFALAYKRNITEGVGNIALDSIAEVNPALESKLKEYGYDEETRKQIVLYSVEHGTLTGCDLVTKEIQAIFRVADEIPWIEHIKVQAAWQKYISNSISKTINCNNNTTADEIYNIYFEMWNHGLKGGTIYRDGSKSFQILEKISDGN